MEDESAEVAGVQDVGELDGPMAYRNWQAMKRLGGEPSSGSEFLLYGDAVFVGDHWTFGPYETVNTLAGPTSDVVEHQPLDLGSISPPVALRTWIYLGHDEWIPSTTSTNVASFTGTDVADEVAVLLSLLTARRLRAGGAVRTFRSMHEPGQAQADASTQMPQRPPRHQRRLPRQVEPTSITPQHVELLRSYTDLPAPTAVALARAARAYRDAIWIGESQPELAWLLLVSAVECAANAEKRIAEVEPLARLRTSRSSLAKKIVKLGLAPEQERQLAKELAPLFKATEKFTGFLVRFSPTVGPTPRPDWGAFPWAHEDAKRQALDLVYEHRSNALHEALPIPYPMLVRPSRGEEVSSIVGALGAVWLPDRNPMLLHTFEYMVQNALVNWWRSLVFPERATVGGEVA
jgi:hypothetical protein